MKAITELKPIERDEIVRILRENNIEITPENIKALELIETERKMRLESKDGKYYIQKSEIIHKKGLYERFFTLNQDFLLYVIECKLNGTQRRILDVLMAYMENDNIARITQSNISKITGIKTANVSNAIKILLEKEIIFNYEKKGQEKRYGVNYYLNKNMGVKARQTDKEYLDYHKAQMKKERVFLNEKSELKPDPTLPFGNMTGNKETAQRIISTKEADKTYETERITPKQLKEIKEKAKTISKDKLIENTTNFVNKSQEIMENISKTNPALFQDFMRAFQKESLKKESN